MGKEMEKSYNLGVMTISRQYSYMQRRNYMRQYQVKGTKEIKEMSKMICNCCGKEIPVRNGQAQEGVFSADYIWGYFSEKDGERHSFELCEMCYDKWIASFCIPVEIEG